MASATQLIDLRKRWVSAAAMANALGIDRTTLWRRESYPEEAKPAFWAEYANALRAKISPQAQEALRALDVVSEVAAGAAA